MFTQKEIRDRHRSKQWVKDKEAAYSAVRYTAMKANPKLYKRRLRQACDSAIIRKWRGLAVEAGLLFDGKSRHELAAIFTIALLQLEQESVAKNKARRREYENKRNLTRQYDNNRDRSGYYAAIKSDPEKLAKFRTKRNAAHKAWYALNKDRIRSDQNRRARETYKNLDPDKKALLRARNKAWSKTIEGRIKFNGYMRKTRCKYPSRKIADSLRRSLNNAIRGKRKQLKIIALLGMSIWDFMLHIASQWAPGMTWRNYGFGVGNWTLDHKLPCAAFDLTDTDQQKLCFHYSNMQPMWFCDNCSKGNKLPDGTRATRRASVVDSAPVAG